MEMPDKLSKDAFEASLRMADLELKARLPRLAALEGVKQVIVYSYGVRGKDLALQLRDDGVECLIFDNSVASRARAESDGFATTGRLDLKLPLLVAAGQNQIEIMASLEREAYSLAETLYGLNIRNSYGPARRFSLAVLEEVDALFDVYRRLDERSAAVFLQVLKYRASLDVRHLSLRRPVWEMWTPPVAGLDIRSFCDIGAYDGDSLAATKAVFPGLMRSFTIEPSAAMAPSIAAVANRIGVSNTNYAGAAWSRASRLSARLIFNGMLVIEESSDGDIPTQTLDTLLGEEVFDFIKMDVEGTEAAVMEGGFQSLRRARCIAMAAYHRPRDLVELPRLLSEALGSAVGGDESAEWRLAFVHYSQVFDDSIFYAWRASAS
jgi:FkbM family methyltransferase